MIHYDGDDPTHLLALREFISGLIDRHDGHLKVRLRAFDKHTAEPFGDEFVVYAVDLHRELDRCLRSEAFISYSRALVRDFRGDGI